MKCRFGGINIQSNNPAPVFEFYKKLGFRVLQEPDERWFGAMLALQLGGQTPVIWIWKQGEADREVCHNHLVFLTDGHIDSVYQEICDAGIECEPPFIASWGGKALILHDPDGNLLLFL